MQVYVGIDVHKSKWVVCICTEAYFFKTISLEPKAEVLIQYLHKNFSACAIHAVYEAGFSGFGLQRKLVSAGIDCIIVTPSDVPMSQKDILQKSDRSDSRNLCYQLRNGTLRGIYIPSIEQEQLRSLFRQRNVVVRHLREVKVLIRAQLAYYGIMLPPQYDCNIWSKNKIEWISKRAWSFPTASQSIDSKLRQYNFAYHELLHISNELRAYVRKHHKEDYYLIRSVPGIGPLTAVAILSEAGDIRRFSNTNTLCSYIGLVPNVYSSGSTTYTTGLTPRSKKLLRSYLIESSWTAIRMDMELQQYYEVYRF